MEAIIIKKSDLDLRRKSSEVAERAVAVSQQLTFLSFSLFKKVSRKTASLLPFYLLKITRKISRVKEKYRK